MDEQGPAGHLDINDRDELARVAWIFDQRGFKPKVRAPEQGSGADVSPEDKRGAPVVGTGRCHDEGRHAARVDLIAAWSVDRLGRSLQHLVHFLSDLQALGIDLYLHQQHVDTTTPSGRALFQMMGVFAEFERAMIRERVNAGLARAKANGKVLGRPKVKPAVEQRIRHLRAQGMGMLKIGRTLGLGTGTVQRVVSNKAKISRLV
jgi:DNA invertase Pin-like site-specific DNA recombinase